MDSSSAGGAAAAAGMGFLPALGIGAGVGLLKNLFFDAPREARERKVAAATQRYSPWTRLQPGPIHTANPMGDALQYGLTGAGLFQSGENANSDRAFKAAMMEAMKNNRSPNPWGLSTGGGPGLGVNTNLMGTLSPEFRPQGF